MTTESREQILLEFQEWTRLENMEECIHILEQHQWNLQAAVQDIHERIGIGHDNESTVPSGQAPNNSSATSTTGKRQSDSDEFEDADEPRIIKTVPGSQRTTATATSGPVRDLNFTIQYCDQTVNLTVYDSESVQDLKAKIAHHLNVPVHQQHFVNWLDKNYEDRTVLKDLRLPKQNVIHLTAIVNGSASRTDADHSTSTFSNASVTGKVDFPLTVQCETNAGQPMTIQLVMKPSTTIREIKQQIAQTTHIPIEEQSWNGLYGAQDSDQLGRTQIPLRATLLVRRSVPPPRRDPTRSTVSTERGDDEQMDVDMEIIAAHNDDDDDDDDVAVPSGNTSTTTTTGGINTGREPLIPDGCNDDFDALEHFSRAFHARYGLSGPILYIGSLDHAIQESLYATIDNRRPLAIYLHNDQSVCANVFCSQVLTADSIVEYLANNYVLWAWDMTSDINRNRLIETIRRCVGNQCAQRLATTESDAFPLLLILTRSRGTLELLEIIEGKSTPSEVLLNLIQCHDSFNDQRQRDTEEELKRERREELKREQEDEYRRSLAADLEKERLRQDDERKQREQQNANEQLQKQRLQLQRECQARLPEEPSETEKNITRFKIRLPDDDVVLLRRFRISDNLQMLFDYLTSHGRMTGEYKLLTAYPKRDLTTLDGAKTFEQLKLYPQEQLILESL